MSRETRNGLGNVKLKNWELTEWLFQKGCHWSWLKKPSKLQQ